jgi:hypothetical protein
MNTDRAKREGRQLAAFVRHAEFGYYAAAFSCAGFVRHAENLELGVNQGNASHAGWSGSVGRNASDQKMYVR